MYSDALEKENEGRDAGGFGDRGVGGRGHRVGGLDAGGHGGHGHGGHTHENYSARAHPEFVVLDIGDDVGALIVHTDADLHATEVEISPTGEDDRRAHKDVLERSIEGRSAYTAVFYELAEGTYTLWSCGEALARDVAITGGTIVEVDWRRAAVAA
jgi:hypothetical protein